MTSKTVLHSLKHSPQDHSAAEIYFKEYKLETHLMLDRDGIFFSVFNKMFDPHYLSIPHILNVEFEAFNAQEIFYQISSVQKQTLNSAGEILFLFHLNQQVCSLEMLGDFLYWFKQQNTKAAKYLAHFDYDVDLKNQSDQIYLAEYFKTIQKYLGQIPETVSVLQLEKKAVFSETLVVEAATQWKCTDNYLVHLILSKGGSFYQRKVNGPEFDVMSTEKLSPFHCLQVLKRKTGHQVNCQHFSEIKKKNFLKYPEEIKVFNYLIYKNLYK